MKQERDKRKGKKSETERETDRKTEREREREGGKPEQSNQVYSIQFHSALSSKKANKASHSYIFLYGNSD